MSGPGPSRSLAAAPDPVRAAAVAHDLGDRYFTYGTAPSKVLVTCASALGTGIVAQWLWYGVATAEDVGGLPIFAVLVSMLAVYWAVVAVRALGSTGASVHLFDRGLVHAAGSGTRVYPWAEDRGAAGDHPARQQRAGDQHRVRLPPAPGRGGRAAAGLVGVRPGGPGAGDRAPADPGRALPLDLDAVAAGRTVRYGPLALDIATPTTPKAVLKWTQVRAIDLHDGTVRIWTFENRRAQQVQISSVPNVFVFAALADALRIDAQRA